jgi:hypothetical protein
MTVRALKESLGDFFTVSDNPRLDLQKNSGRAS